MIMQSRPVFLLLTMVSVLFVSGCASMYQPKQPALPAAPEPVATPKPAHPLVDYPLPPYVVIDRIDLTDVAE